MSADALIDRVHRGARTRTAWANALLALPWIAALAAIAWRLDLPAWRWLLPLLPAAYAAARIAQRWRGMDRAWLARTLDAKHADMEDSAALLVGTAAPRNALETLQRARLRQRAESRPHDDLRAPWPGNALVANALAAVAVFAAALLWPATPASNDAIAAAPGATTSSEGPPQIRARSLSIAPPAYTGLPTRRSDTLAARVPENATLTWTLRFAPQPARAELVFLDGTRLALRREGEAWTARRTLSRSTLYRIEAPRLAPARDPWRIDVLPDLAPRIRVLAPARTLRVVTPGQRRWAVAFEASDDHGLAASARLRVVRTVGSGENITSQRREIALRGSGSGQRRRYAHTFDLAALGLVPGDDLIVRLEVSDRRTPRAQAATSPSLILRWPPEQGAQSSGLDGLVKRAMPAYFRSQRQIIIDAEALVKEKPRLAVATFGERSDTLGVDQRLLRLRYGQFLGEESEGAPQLPTSDVIDQPPLPTSDAPLAENAAPGNDAPQADAADDDAHSAEGDTHAPGDGHDHGADAPPQRAPAFGEEEQVLERYGHTHDVPEAATLLDPETRELLRTALDAMWSSELALRQADPAGALPHANRALEFIKRVQQSERIYLAKSGVAVAPVDESRRLTGDRKGLASRADPIRAAARAADPVAEAWRALAPDADGDAAALTAQLDALARNPAAQAARGGDPLAIAAAIDALRRDPGCRDCRARLREALWPLLARPPGAPEARAAGDRSGDAYLDALGREARP